jgi:hypothetical protein
MTGLGSPFMNSCRPAPAWLPHEDPGSVGLRPVLIGGAMAASLLGSSLVGIENGFGSLWLVINAGLQLSIAAWLPIRPGSATAGPLSAGVLSAFVLVVCGSWAPALAAGEPFSPLVPGPVEKSALEYTTAAALAVTGGVVLASSVYAMVRGPGSRVNHRPAVPPSRWWRGVLLMEAIGLRCFVAFKVSLHQPVVSLDLFRPLPVGIAQETTSGTYQFLSAGIDVSIGAAIAALGLLGLKAYRLRVLALIVLNLFLYTTLGFKYRIVVTLIGVFGVWAATRPHKGRPAPRSQRMKVVLAGVAVTIVAFHHGKQAPPSFYLDRPAGNSPRDRSSGSLVGRGGRQLRSDRASRLWRDPGVGRLTFGHRRPGTHGNRHDGSSHRSGAHLCAQPLAHVLRSVRVRGDCLSHLDAQPIETSARNPWVLRTAGAGLR